MTIVKTIVPGGSCIFTADGSLCIFTVEDTNQGLSMVNHNTAL